MPNRRRSRLALEAERRNREQVVRLGGELRAGRIRTRRTQAGLGGLVGLSQATSSRAERGNGGGLSLDAWQRVGLAVGRPLVVRLHHEIGGETVDAGHLAVQELVLRLGRGAGYERTFELQTRPSDPWRSVDVCLRDDRLHCLILVECWNTFGDLGAAARATARKAAEMESLAATAWDGQGGSVASLWVVRASARNRALVARYPEIFAALFPGSSADWAGALTRGSAPPGLPGLVWCDLGATRLYPRRRPG